MTPVSPVLPRSAELPSELRTTVWAKHQSQYNSLPAIVSSRETGRTTTRFRLTWRERWKLLFSGNLFVQVLTFGRPLMPIKPMVNEPAAGECL